MLILYISPKFMPNYSFEKIFLTGLLTVTVLAGCNDSSKIDSKPQPTPFTIQLPSEPRQVTMTSFIPDSTMSVDPKTAKIIVDGLDTNTLKYIIRVYEAGDIRGSLLQVQGLKEETQAFIVDKTDWKDAVSFLLQTIEIPEGVSCTIRLETVNDHDGDYPCFEH